MGLTSTNKEGYIFGTSKEHANTATYTSLSHPIPIFTSPDQVQILAVFETLAVRTKNNDNISNNSNNNFRTLPQKKKGLSAGHKIHPAVNLIYRAEE